MDRPTRRVTARIHDPGLHPGLGEDAAHQVDELALARRRTDVERHRRTVSRVVPSQASMSSHGGTGETGPDGRSE